MMENNDLFDIYVINLDKDKERLEKINQRLYPNSFTRIPAVYGNDQDFTNNEEIFYISRYLTPKSALGIALSHRNALRQFIETSDKDIVLILEDDAEPLSENYIEKINLTIQNAPDDWDVIKLDYVPIIQTSDPKYSTSFSTLTTALLVNKRGAKNILQQKIYWHIDWDLNYYNIIIYNSPEKVFTQIWNEENNSNNRNKSLYPGTNGILESLNFKVFRLGNTEFSYNDIIYFLLFVLLFILLRRYYPLTIIREKFKAVLSNSKMR